MRLVSTTETKDKVERRFLLDVVIRKSASILELLTGKDQTLLVRRDSFLVLNLGLDIINGIRSLDIKSNGLSSQSLDKDLHTSAKTKYQMKGRLLLDIVVRQGTSILELLSSKDQTLLIRGNSFLCKFRKKDEKTRLDELHENLINPQTIRHTSIITYCLESWP